MGTFLLLISNCCHFEFSKLSMELDCFFGRNQTSLNLFSLVESYFSLGTSWSGEQQRHQPPQGQLYPRAAPSKLSPTPTGVHHQLPPQQPQQQQPQPRPQQPQPRQFGTILHHQQLWTHCWKITPTIRSKMKSQQCLETTLVATQQEVQLHFPTSGQ